MSRPIPQSRIVCTSPICSISTPVSASPSGSEAECDHMINTGHSSLEFIGNHCKPVADLSYTINGPQERKSEQDRCKQQKTCCYSKEWPQQHEEPAYPK